MFFFTDGEEEPRNTKVLSAMMRKRTVTGSPVKGRKKTAAKRRRDDDDRGESWQY